MISMWRKLRLRLGNEFARKAAVQSLAKTRSPRVLRSLLKALKDEDLYVRTLAACGLGLIRNEKAVEPLSLALCDSHINKHAALALAALATPSAFSALRTALVHENEYVRLAATYGLGAFGRQRASDILDELIDTPLSDWPTEFYGPNHGLEIHEKDNGLPPPEALLALLIVVTDNSPYVSTQARCILESALHLLDANDNDRQCIMNGESKPLEQLLRQHTASRLFSRGELLACITRLNDSTTRREAISTLRGQPANAAIAAIKEEMLSSIDYIERAGGYSALGFLGREFGWAETIPLLESGLNDEQEYPVEEAMWGLNWISYNEPLKSAAVSAVLRNIERLVAIFAQTNDCNASGKARALLEMAGEACVPYLVTLLPKLTDEDKIEFTTGVLERFKASPTLTKPAILESLRSNDVALRKKACYNSIDVADSEVVAALIEVMERFPEAQYNAREDVYQSTRKGAAFALGKIGDSSAIPGLRKALKADSPWGVRNDGTLVKGVTGMPAFGTSVREGLEEADTQFARSVLAEKQLKPPR